MNKKFLSAILFGALMVSSTGTFVSCKDYDDDIDRIDNTLNDLKSKLDALQTKIDAGKYITNVTTTADGITITLSDGTSYPITNGKPGEPGAAGDKIEINEDGYFVINDKPTEWMAVKKDQLGQVVKIKTPTVSEDGCWVFYDEKGEAHPTTIKVAPVTAVQNPDKSWTLTVYAADGSAQTIKLPTAASMITEAEVLGYLYVSTSAYTSDGVWYPIADGVANNRNIPYNFSIVGNLTTDQNDWNKETGVKKLVKGQALSTIASYRSNLMVRIAPATLDASELSFSLVNSKLESAPLVLGTPVAYEGLLTRAAVSGNGLWQIPVSTVEGKTYKDEAAYIAQFEVAGANNNGTTYSNQIAFALREEGGFATNFDLTFDRDARMSLTTGLQDNYNVELNKASTVNFDTPANVYDAHIHFTEADVIRWGIVYNGGTEFTVTKLADQITVPQITATVHYVTLDGEVHKEPINIKPAKVNANITELAKNTILVKADNNKNNFTAALKPMFDNLGTTATTLWRADVFSQTVELFKVKSGDEVYDTSMGTGAGQIVVTYDKAALGEINTIKVALDAANTLSRFENYYVLINYNDKNGEVLSTLKVPFNIAIPAITSLLNKEKVVFNGTNNGTGVLNEKDLNAAGDAIYSLKYAFVGQLADAFADNTTMTFAVDPNQKIKVDGVDKAMNTLVTVNNASEKTASIQLTDKKNAYNKSVSMIVKDAKYLGRYAYTADEMKTAAFTMTIVSPIERGTLEAVGGVINVVATEDGKARISESDLVAKTYAGIAYKIFKDKFVSGNNTATEWTSPYIKADAEFKSTNENVFTLGEVKAATKDDKGNVTPGYVVVNPMNVAYEDAVPVKITVADAWGYKKEVTINVKVSPKK